MSISAYQTTIGDYRTAKKSISPADDAFIVQTQQLWLHSPVTAKLFYELQQEIDNLEKQASSLSVTFATHNNHLQIILLLNRAAELRKVIEKYGK
jgi:hypothetical protein